MIAPMLAKLARELPRGDYLYEPKWDGFRCLALAAPDEIDLRSRHGRPLARYFPELVAALEPFASRRCIFDGEVVIVRGGALDFAALMNRTHPAASRVALLARETPATYVAFDLLGEGAANLLGRPFVERRTRLEALLPGASGRIVASPVTGDVRVAEDWLARFQGRGIDGVVAKLRTSPYEPGKRTMIKVRTERTADCVVAGMRLRDPRSVSSLLLGLHDGDVLRHVGVATSFTASHRRALLEELRPLVTRLPGHPWERGFNVPRSPMGRLPGAAVRWSPEEMGLDWIPLRPERVGEFAYDQVDAGRFRHSARFVRWRPDREARSCRLDQVEVAPPSLDAMGLAS